MRFSIISEIPGRTRLQLAGPVPESDLDALLKLSGDIDGVHKVRVYGRIGQMALEYDEQRRAAVLDALDALDAQAIADAGIIKNTRDGIKILGRGELERKLTVIASAFSASAKEKIEAAGGKAEVK